MKGWRRLCLAGIVVALWLACGVCVCGQTRRKDSPEPQASRRTARPVAISGRLLAESLGRAPLPYTVLLPAEYEASARRYPVLYLLHGLTGGENDWLTRTNLSLYAAQYHLIIVMPGVGDSWYANSVSDPRARYEEAIVRDLIKHIDALYRTLASGYGRAVAGLSMGGLGALKFALRYPELFAFAASFSGAFDVPRLSGLDGASDRLSQTARSVYGERDSQTRRDDDLFLLLERIKPERTRLPYLYVSVGTNDALSSVMPSNPRLAEALRAHKIQYEYHERPGSHDWRFWDAEIGSALKRMSDFIPQMNKEQR